ncbi:MAG: hypothetical protein ABI321_10195 [Polyangia bacterium]
MAAKDEGKAQGYKRINFFRGFLTTEHDWNEAERYHLEKRRLHNKHLHAPGVVPGNGGELRVQARARGDFSMEVQPGYALDGAGNDLVLWDAQLKTIAPEEYKLPQTLYVVLRYTEELTDFIAYKENIEYKGHRRVLEGCKVEISQTPPDIKQEVELARILLEKNATRIRDARDPLNPQANEIDLRYVPRAGVTGSFLDTATRLRVTQMFAGARRSFMHMARDGKVQTAHDALSAVLTASALHASEQLDLRNVFEVLQLLVEMQVDVATDVEVNHPQLAQKKEFADFRKHMEILKGLITERRFTLDALTNLLGYEQKANEIVGGMFAGLAPAISESPRQVPASTSADWETVKTMGVAELPAELQIAGRTWTLVDSIDVMDKTSEESHALAVHDAKDAYRSRQKLKYPDGTEIEDAGRAHVGGYTSYNVKNLTAGKELAIVRRMDYVYGDYELEFQVDGKPAGTCSCAGTDRVHRWRNWPYVIPAETVTKSQVAIKQSANTAERDINMFRYWFYQPK